MSSGVLPVSEQPQLLASPSLTSSDSGALPPMEELHLLSGRRQLWAMLWLLVIPPLWFSGQEWILGGGSQSVAAMLVRLSPAMPAIAGLLWYRKVHDQPTYSRLAFLVGIGTAAALLLSFAARPESEAIALRGRLLAPALMYLLLPNSFGRQVGPPLVLCAGFALMRVIRLDALDWAVLSSDLMIVGALNAAGILMVRHRLHLEAEVGAAWARERNALLASERARADLKTLRGLLPICAHCKKIRTEVGDWQQVERYVQQHTEARFSHGICPTCRVTHYPELFSGPAEPR